MSIFLSWRKVDEAVLVHYITFAPPSLSYSANRGAHERKCGRGILSPPAWPPPRSVLPLLPSPTTSPPFDLHMILNYNGRNRDDRVEESAAARESVSLSLAPARPSPVGLIKYLLTDRRSNPRYSLPHEGMAYASPHWLASQAIYSQTLT